MKNYYEELIQEMKEMVELQQYEEALFRLKTELQMPYIPEEYEREFLSLEKDIRFALENQKKDHEIPLESLLHMLKGKPESQMIAANALSNRNLRSCVKELQDYLSKDPTPEAAELIVDAIAEQEIKEEFVWVRNGVEYTFFGDSVTPVAKSEGFLEAMRLLEERFEKEPSLLEMARILLIHKSYEALPIGYKVEEAKMIVNQIKDEIEELMNQN